MASLDSILPLVLERGASDLHISPGQPALLRVGGSLQPLSEERLSPEMTRSFLYGVMTEEQVAAFEQDMEIDFAYEVPGLARLRFSVFTQQDGVAGVCRLVPCELPDAVALGLPPQVMGFCEMPRGLVLVTGSTGSGKSTTLAAMIDSINANRHEHILTIEDPIEFIHPNKQSLVNQREIGTHTRSFSAALRSALREDPDIILVGEMRDLETIQLAITAAETGHLVFGTLHTNSAAGAVDRIIDAFPSDQQAQIRVMLSESLRGVVAQRLLRSADGRGRVAAFEILKTTPALANLMRDGKTHQFEGIMQTGRKDGMLTLDMSLKDLVQAGRLDPAEAARHASSPGVFATMAGAA